MTTTQTTGHPQINPAGAELLASDGGEILVPIDFSNSSVQALHQASELATRRHACLTLLNVTEEPRSFRILDFTAHQRHAHHAHLSQLENLAHQEVNPQVPVKLLVREGEPADQIRRVAREHNASLIVLGRHAHHGMDGWLRRNTVRRLAQQLPCPVLVLGEDGGKLNGAVNLRRG